MTWVAYLVETRTGIVGKRLDIAASGSWSIPAVGIEEWDVTVSRAELRRIDPVRWSPWWASVLVCWEASDGRQTPWLLGPITTPPTEHPASDTATLTCRGVGALLEHRVVLARDYDQQDGVGEMTWLAKSTVALRGMSLGTIAQEVVKYATWFKPGGRLPIRFATPREEGARLNERTYEGWNLANNGAWKRLMELSEVRGGPNIQFRPEWASEDQTTVQWAMHTGTVAQHGIAQDWTMDLDATSTRSMVAKLDVKVDATALTHRHYQTGAGEGAGTLVRMAQDLTQVADGVPLLETVAATSDSENPALVQAHAEAALKAGARPVRQVTVTIDGSDPRCEIGRWHAGDLVQLTVGSEWLTIPAGTTLMRVIAVKGSWASSMVDLELQED